MLHAVEFEPTTTGTTIHFRYAQAKTRRERELMEHIAPAYAQALQSGFPSLVAELDAAFAAREADRGPEPALATPKPDGPLSGIEPLVNVS